MEKTFELKSLKVFSGGVDCRYIMTETAEDGTVSRNEYRVQKSAMIHPDLAFLFEKILPEIMAGIFDNTQFSAEIAAGGQSCIIPSGISFAGKNDNIGVVISGKILTPYYGGIMFKTPRIRYINRETTVALQLTEFAEKVASETEAYLFENKVAEMEIFG